MANVEELFVWLDKSPSVERWRMFNVTLEDVFNVIGGCDEDAGQVVTAGCCAGVGRCCCGYASCFT